MLFYPTLFLGLLYFKVFRVRRQQEQGALTTTLEAVLANTAIVALIGFGFMAEAWYSVLLAAVLFNIMASLMITAVQLGIFVDGKPLFGLSRAYTLMPWLAFLVISGTAGTISINSLG